VTAEQGQFTFDEEGNELGYKRWQEEMDAQKRAFESRWGVILSRTVRVQLRNHLRPVEGSIRQIGQFKSGRNLVPRLQVGNIEFSPDEIESVVVLEL